MSQTKKVPVSGAKIKTYRTSFRLCYKRFAKAIENQRKKNVNIPETERSGPSKSTVVRMEKDNEATQEVIDDTLETIQVLTKKAHEDSLRPDITRDTLPIPTDLKISIKMELKRQKERDLQKKNNESTAATPPETVAVIAQQQPQFDGASHTKRVLSQFECYSELAQLIRNSKTAEVLYASIGLGWTLKFLMAGLNDLKVRTIDHIAVRGSTIHHGDGEKHIDLDSLRRSRQNILMSIHKTKYAGEYLDIKYYTWHTRPEFHGYMYGSKVIYSGDFCTNTNYLKFDPEISRMRRITNKGSMWFWKHQRLFMYGTTYETPSEIPDRILEEPKIIYSNGKVEYKDETYNV